MVRALRQFFFGRWLRVQGGDVSIVPLLILLAIALSASWFNRPRHEVFPLSSTISFKACDGRVSANCVVDGDTIWAEGEKVRLADIDAPEIFSPECEWERHMGHQATERLTALLNDGEVALKKTSSRDSDKYGRLLREATVDGKSVGMVLVREGLAHKWGGPQRSWCT